MSDKTTSTTRGAWLLALVGIAAMGGLGVLAAMNTYVFVLKVMIVPVLFLIAFAAGRLKGFVTDWAVFLSFIVMFDMLRGLIFALITAFDLPVYMGYAIRWEQFLTQMTSLNQWMQQRLYDPPIVGPFEKFLIVVYGSHFLFFLLFAAFVWTLRHQDFWRCKAGITIVLLVGAACYLLIPTVPPWMASGQFHVLPPIRLIRADVHYVGVSAIQNALDINPIAAMPSLHMALPVFCTLAAWFHFRWRALPILIYAATILFAVVYLGEHYIVDALAGIALAIGAYLVAYHWPRFRSLMEQEMPGATDTAVARKTSVVRRRVAMSGFILLASFALGVATLSLRMLWLPKHDFIERELIGKSDVAHFYLGWAAYVDDNYREAKEALSRALVEMPAGDPYRVQAALLLGHSAFEMKDYPLVVRVLAPPFPQNKLEAVTCASLGAALVETRNTEIGFHMLSECVQRFRSTPDPLFWLTWYEFKAGRISLDRVREVHRQLTDQGHSAAAKRLENLITEAAASSAR